MLPALNKIDLTHNVCYNGLYFYKELIMLSANKVRTNVYLDAEIKAKAQAIFKQYGLGLSEAFNIFLTQSVMERGIPFEVKIPNKETITAMEDARMGRNMESVTLEQLQEEMKRCITQ